MHNTDPAPDNRLGMSQGGNSHPNSSLPSTHSRTVLHGTAQVIPKVNPKVVWKAVLFFLHKIVAASCFLGAENVKFS